MTFGGKVNNGIDMEFIDDFFNERAVADVAFNKFMVRMVEKTGEVFEISGVGELVKIDDEAVAVLGENHSHEIASNKTCTACNKYFHNCFKNFSKGTCQGSMGLPSKAAILPQLKQLLSGLFAAEGKS